MDDGKSAVGGIVCHMVSGDCTVQTKASQMKISHKNDGRNLLIRDRNENGHFWMRCPFCFQKIRLKTHSDMLF